MTPDGFSVGFNDAVDHPVAHACIHIVPRRRGDDVELPDGIEWVTNYIASNT